MVSEIQSGTDRIFCHYGPFLLFYPPNNLQNQSFENMKRAPGDVIILHMCTKSDIHIMYGSRDMEHDRQNFLSFWTIFCSLPQPTPPPPSPPRNPENQNFEGMKKTSGDIILHMCIINNDHMYSF